MRRNMSQPKDYNLFNQPVVLNVPTQETGRAHSLLRLAAGWTVQGPNAGGGEAFCAVQIGAEAQ